MAEGQRRSTEFVGGHVDTSALCGYIPPSVCSGNVHAGVGAQAVHPGGLTLVQMPFVAVSRCDIDGKKALCRCGGKGVIISKCDTAHLVLTTKVDSGIMSVVDTYKSVVHRCHPQTAVAVGDYVVNLVHPEAFRRVDACNVIAIAI